jgi:PPOX class probable F420-dependent enzyme
VSEKAADASPPSGPAGGQSSTAAGGHLARAAGDDPNQWVEGETMAIPIPGDVRQLLDAPNYVHLSTLRADGSPRNWVVWVGLEDDHILVCTSDAVRKAKDMRRDPRVALSVTDMANPYRMAAIQGRVVDVRPDEGCATWTRSPSSTPTRHSPAAAPIAYVS